MSQTSDLLSQTEPLADPLRLFSTLFVALAIVDTLIAVAFGNWSGLGAVCALIALALMVVPLKRPNAIYLRAFRMDKETAKLRAEIAAILGPDFRLSGIRAPNKRTSILMRLLFSGVFAIRYAGSKFMELEAGDDWMARLWKSYQNTRLVLIDVRDLTSALRDELRMTFESVGLPRMVFLIDGRKTELEWRRLVAEAIGPDVATAEIRVMDVSAGRMKFGQLQSDLKQIVHRLPLGVPGDNESGRRFILDHVSPDLLKRGWSPAIVKAGWVAGFFSVAVMGSCLLPLVTHTALGWAVLIVGFAASWVVTAFGLSREAARAIRLKHAGHPRAGTSAWCLVGVESLLFIAAPLFPIAYAIPQLKALGSEAEAVMVVTTLRLLNTTQDLYKLTYPEVGFACELSALGGPNFGEPTPQAARLIERDPTRSGNYIFAVTKCGKIAVDGHDVAASYEITAKPVNKNPSRKRTFCTNQDGELSWGLSGSGQCNAPYR